MTHKNAVRHALTWRYKTPENLEKALTCNRIWKRKYDAWKKISKEFLKILL